MNAVFGKLIQQARESFMHLGDDIKIDDDAQISEAENGIWVQAWIYVPYPDEPEDDTPS